MQNILSRALGLVFLLTATTFTAAVARPCIAAGGVVETENFRLIGVEDQASGRQVAGECEQLRSTLFTVWLHQSAPEAWRPRCELVLHATDAGYLAAVGRGAGATVASSLVSERGRGITQRRIDVRAERHNWQLTALPHELTHIVLADHFIGRTLPRWADEGMAILADTPDKRSRHAEDLLGAMATGRDFRLVELLELSTYPSSQRWGTFYGQSASVVAHLIDRGSPAQFVQFLDVVIAQGHSRALRSVYGFSSIADCERTWRRELIRQPDLLAQRLASHQLAP